MVRLPRFGVDVNRLALTDATPRRNLKNGDAQERIPRLLSIAISGANPPRRRYAGRSRPTGLEREAETHLLEFSPADRTNTPVSARNGNLPPLSDRNGLQFEKSRIRFDDWYCES